MEGFILMTITAALSLAVAILSLYFLYSVVEYYYGLLTNKPFFVHFYYRIKRLSPDQQCILYKKVPFYHQLSAKNKNYFEHRIAVFIQNHRFIGKSNFMITDEVRVLIASTSVMLTFGMRNYLFKIINKIIVYPTTYYSTIKQEFHKGEFNPKMRAVVFSWDDFVSGYTMKNDNLNLGIHEFAHVLHHHCLKKPDASAMIFLRMYNRIQKEINHPPNRERLINSDYFRIYAYTNAFEFLAVLLEHFFETPDQFRIVFPELYQNVATMIHFQQQ